MRRIPPDPSDAAWRWLPLPRTVLAASVLVSLTSAVLLVGRAVGQETCFGSTPTITGSGMVVGTDGDDVILGSPGQDTVQGRGGNDKVCGGDGDDTVGGGPGNDQVDGGAGNDTVAGGPGDDTVLGGEGNDTMTGGSENDVCDGGTGTNTAPTTGFEACETVRNANGASGERPSFKLAATLDRRQEVPRPRDARGAKGTFTATLTRTAAGGKLKWRLRFSDLSGRGLASHIHTGRRGKAGRVVMTLCSPCSSGAHGTASVNGANLFRAIKNGGTYVNVHTKRNPGGEIRGQIHEVT